MRAQQPVVQIITRFKSPVKKGLKTGKLLTTTGEL
jgi:hypothetical protein